MYIQRSGLDEPDILKRRVRSTRGKRSRKTTLFSTRSIPKIPQIENTVDLFDKIINALRSAQFILFVCTLIFFVTGSTVNI